MTVRDETVTTSEPYRYDDWFRPVPIEKRHQAVTDALAYADACNISDHAFFDIAESRSDALRLWVSQELVVTGPFSQELLRLASLMPNVQMRAMVMVVINGEHGRVSKGCAKRSHPWLLDQLRSSMEMRPDDVRPLPETVDFLAQLHTDVANTLTGLAATGIGNERLILSEYTAIKKSFANCWSGAEYEPFLNANICEDMAHSEILSDVASSLIITGSDAALYYDSAVRNVQSRVTYYDRLAERVRSLP